MLIPPCIAHAPLPVRDRPQTPVVSHSWQFPATTERFALERHAALPPPAWRSVPLKDDADRFLLRIKRNGVFMHSTNHPRADTLVLLAKFVAMHLGEDGSVLDREILIDDGLSLDIWPVYPEIADHLGVAGSGYRWRIGGHTRITGLADYLSYAYDSYAAQGMAPEDIVVFHYDDSKLDAVLAPQAGL